MSTCPFTGKKMALVPALSFIHVHEADVYGNASFEGIAVADIELANASKRLLITCERLVPHGEIARASHRTQILYFIVDAAYNEMEMMIVTASKELENGATVGVGTGGANDFASFCWKMMVMTTRTNSVLLTRWIL